MKNIEEVPWAALYAELWPEAWRRREISIEAMEASVGDRVRHLGAGEISRALQSIAERQRSGDKGTPAGPPSANRLVSEIIRARFVARRPPDECQTRIEATRAERQARLRAAPDHQTRWDIICEARDPAECMALHRWTCAEWPDFPATVVDVPDAWRGNVKALLADALVEQAAVEAGLAAEEYVQFRGGGTPCPETAGSVSPGTADKIEAGACRVSGHGVCREATNPARNRASSSPVGSRALDTQNAEYHARPERT